MHFRACDESLDDILGATFQVSDKVIVVNESLLTGSQLTLAAVVAHEMYHLKVGRDEPPAYLIANEVVRWYRFIRTGSFDTGYEYWLGKRDYMPDNWSEGCIYGQPLPKRERGFPARRVRR